MTCSELSTTLAWVQAGSSLLLVLVTIVYVVLTWRMAQAASASAQAASMTATASQDAAAAGEDAAKEAALQRRATSEPLLSLEGGRLEWYGGQVVRAVIEIANHGAGPGFGVVVTLESSEGVLVEFAPRGAMRAGSTVVAQGVLRDGLGWADLERVSASTRCTDAFGSDMHWHQTVRCNRQTGNVETLGPPSRHE